MGFSACPIPPVHNIKLEQINSTLQLESGLTGSSALEKVTNNTMVGLIAQMGILTSLATSIFSELVEQTTHSAERIQKLGGRVTQASSQLKQLEGHLQNKTCDDILFNTVAKFRSDQDQESQLFSSRSMNPSARIAYEKASRPPTLELLDPLMEGGQKSLELYTNPNFFIQKWVQEQIKLREEAKKERRKRREERNKGKTASNRNQLTGLQPKKIISYRYDPTTGEKIAVTESVNTAALPEIARVDIKSTPLTGSDSLPPSSSKSTLSSSAASSISKASGATLTHQEPHTLLHQHQVASPQASQGSSYHTTPVVPAPIAAATPVVPTPISAAADVPAPPPAPAPPSAPPPPSAPLPPSAPSFGGLNLGSVTLKTAAAAEKPVDSRTSLLDHIRQGTQLRNVNQREVKKEEKPEELSVAAILSRRIAIVGDSDDDEDDESDWDD